VRWQPVGITSLLTENAFLVAKYAGNVIIVIILPARCCCCDAVTASVPLDSKAGALAQPVLHAILHIALCSGGN